IEQLVHDADDDGTSLSDFMRGVMWGYYVTGCDVVTQMTAPKTDQPVETLADQQREGLRPYWLRFAPIDRYDWATSGSGKFLWARFCLGALPRRDETEGSPAKTEFLTLTDTEWRKHIAWREKDTDTNQEVLRVDTRAGFHSFGRPPIIKAYFAESQRTGQGAVPVSLISRATLVAKVALNLKSQADAELLGAVPRWLFAGDAAPPDTYGPSEIWYCKDANAKLEVVQGDVDHIVEKRAWLVLYLSEILRLLKFRGGMGDVEGNQASGVKLALEMTDLQNELRATAGFMEGLELEMMRQAVIMATGTIIEPHQAADVLKYECHYNRDFILEPVADMLANIKLFVKDCGYVAEEVPEMLKEMLRQLANLLAREGSPVAEQIATEIDAASFEGVAAAPLEAEPEPESDDETVEE
ncbi:MAG TPA: hypothetical protein VM238_14330, partial [Phycisphaerae bacterium]|nr:hypothetical protein [Phycisphaerae bacterium]